MKIDLKFNKIKTALEDDGYFEVNSDVYVMTREAVEAEQKEWCDEDENKHFDFSTHPYWLVVYGQNSTLKGYYTIKDLIEGALVEYLAYEITQGEYIKESVE